MIDRQDGDDELLEHRIASSAFCVLLALLGSVPAFTASLPDDLDALPASAQALLDRPRWLDSRATGPVYSGGEMSEIRPEPYEAPSVEEVDTDGKPIATAPGVFTSTT